MRASPEPGAIDCLRWFHPVLASRDLKQAPVRVLLNAAPFVLFRDGAGTARAFADHCPHRFAPLSLGSVGADGRLICPYHGMKFDSEGVGESQSGKRKLMVSSVGGVIDRSQPCADVFQVIERRETIWLAARLSDPATLPEVDFPGFIPVESFSVLFEAPLALVLDNFGEDEHLPWVHTRLGWDQEHAREVEHHTDVFPDRTEVHYSGAQRPSALLRTLLVQPDDIFHNDWVHRFDPVRATYDIWWTSPAGEPRPLRNRVTVFFVPETDKTTRLFVFPSIGVDPKFEQLTRPLLPMLKQAAHTLGRIEVEDDAKFLKAMTERQTRTDLKGARLNPFDKALIHNRKLLQTMYAPKDSHAPAATPSHPSRYVYLDAARARHGERVDQVGNYLLVGDPLADSVVEALAGMAPAVRTQLVDDALRNHTDHHQRALPQELRELLEPLLELPSWADPARMERGAATYIRTALTGGLVLGCYSLVLGYCSPTGNKPLARSGRLQGAARRRLAETSRFVQAVITPAGMHIGGEGWISAIKVRLMHASVRRILLACKTPVWPTADYGLPINAFDSAGTILLFSQVMLDGLGQLGVYFRPQDREDVLHLWRYVGHVMGVPSGLLFANDAAAHTFWDLVKSTQEPPDDDSRILTHTLLDEAIAPTATNAAERIHSRNVQGLAYAVARKLLGPTFSTQLELPPPDHWDHTLQAAIRIRKVITRTPFTDAATYVIGRRYWAKTVTNGLGGTPAEFAMFARLGRAVD